MAKFKYTTEFEINASPKMVYPYLSTASGLQEWFADSVESDEDKQFDIVWDGDRHQAKVTAKRANNHVKFQFLPRNDNDEHDPSILEFRLDYNELTQTTFLKVIDYSDMDNESDLKELWGNLIDNLCEILGSSQQNV